MFFDSISMLSKKALMIVGGISIISALAVSPAHAQEAAFIAPEQNPAFIGGAGSMPGRPITTSTAASENRSNLKHWQTFSRGGQPMFVRVPAGTVTAKGQSHYRRPNCVAPGQTSLARPSGNGMVKRYLAYNVPPATASKPKVIASVAPVSNKVRATQSHSDVPVLSYSGRSAVVTGSVRQSPRHTAIAFYHSY